MKYLALRFLMMSTLIGFVSANDRGKLQVYLLVGQSNMQGHAKVETFDYIGDDAETAPLLKKMLDKDGSPKAADNVWISYLTGKGDQNGVGFGKLKTGYGARSNPSEDGGKIGPEYTFGLTLDENIEAPILIIKTAWGGKSLFYDFRPPSAGAYLQSDLDREKGRNLPESSGHYYRLMMEHVKHVLNDPAQIVPGYDNAKGYDLKGVVWFQGWNDMVNRNVYPTPGKGVDPNQQYQTYSQLLTQFINSVRADLNEPDLPFVIGVMGVGGENAEKQTAFRFAMAQPAEQNRNVVAVHTCKYWSEELAAISEKRGQVKQMAYFLRTNNKKHANKDRTMDKQAQQAYLANYEAELISEKEQAIWKRGASNAGYHYLGCAKTFALMGEGFAEALLGMENEKVQ